LETVAKKNLYEGMFLVDSAEAGMDWDGVMASITKILDKAKAEIVSIRKWDDRRLAYDIRRVSRGTYILTYFRVEGAKVQEIEKAVQLSEKIMRVLILNAENVSAEDIAKETPATRAETEGSHEGREPDREVRDDRPDKPQDDPAAETQEDGLGEPQDDPAAEAQEDGLGEQNEEETDDAQESHPRTMADD